MAHNFLFIKQWLAFRAGICGIKPYNAPAFSNAVYVS
jgi:hypothetical protein